MSPAEILRSEAAETSPEPESGITVRKNKKEKRSKGKRLASPIEPTESSEKGSDLKTLNIENVTAGSGSSKVKKSKRKEISNDDEKVQDEGVDGKTVLKKTKKVKGERIKEVSLERETKDDVQKDTVECHQVTLDGCESSAVKPLLTFQDEDLQSAVNSKLLKACESYEKPSTIQSYAWPILLTSPASSKNPKSARFLGRDFVGIAKTGSGKTLAFAVPAFHHAAKVKGIDLNASVDVNAIKSKFREGPSVLVLAPTRELACQITEVMEKVGTECGMNSLCLYGGVSKSGQKQQLRALNPAAIVATPGRLEDLLKDGAISLRHVSFVVLDEGDRMLDLGFEQSVRFLISHVKKERQTVMLSATWPPSVHQLAGELLNKPIKVIAGSQELAANHDVKQIVEVVDSHSKESRLLQLLKEYHKSRKNRILVFVLYKKEASRVENFLSSRGFSVCAVHGDMSQFERTKAVNEFKKGSIPLLIATDVAARGLDIPDVEFVINFSFPLTTEDYIHRIGRTGRAGRKGTAHTLFTAFDKARCGELVNVLREAGQEVSEDLLKFGTTVKKKESKLYGAHFRDISAADAAKSATKIKFDSDDDE